MIQDLFVDTAIVAASLPCGAAVGVDCREFLPEEIRPAPGPQLGWFRADLTEFDEITRLPKLNLNHDRAASCRNNAIRSHKTVCVWRFSAGILITDERRGIDPSKECSACGHVSPDF